MIYDLELALKALGYNIFRKHSFPKTKPAFLTISVTDNCNSKCRTCNIWKESSKDVLSFEEFQKIFETIGEPYWVTFTGGEPFMREDFKEIVVELIRKASPKIVTIPTNGLLTDKVVEDIKYILERSKGTKVVLNFSFDGTEESYSDIRGVKGYDKLMRTYKKIREIERDDLILGLHTVLSKYNIDDFEEVFREAQNLKPDSYKIEVAENREELANIEDDIKPNEREVKSAIKHLLDQTSENEEGLSQIIKRFRRKYYLRILKNSFEELDCFAGFASCQIASNGEVWACPIKTNSLGNLREHNYRFNDLWRSEKAREVRKEIKDEECSCQLANAFYVNSICNWDFLHF